MIQNKLVKATKTALVVSSMTGTIGASMGCASLTAVSGIGGSFFGPVGTFFGVTVGASVGTAVGSFIGSSVGIGLTVGAVVLDTVLESES